jgi:uncharacterized protein YecT (DUF1311 family)
MILATIATAFVVPARSQADIASPSYACSAKNSPVERIICSDPKLAAEDRLMARFYELARVSAFGNGPSNQPAVQRDWLKSRDKTCVKSSDTSECLRATYAERNEALALAVLFSHPDLALPELRRVDPEAAPMFEAIYLFARSKTMSAADRQRVIGLLQPYRETPGGWGEPADAVKSDEAFAEFVGVRSAGVGGETFRRAFPCAAVVRKPKLIEATEPRFGSNMDNFIFRSDCEDTLPPLPKFGTLVDKRISGLGDCGGGSIRFAYYLAFINATVAARLATPARLSKKAIKPFPRRRNVSSADISAALDELAAYYVRYGRARAEQSRPLARQMIYKMLDEAWQC